MAISDIEGLVQHVQGIVEPINEIPDFNSSRSHVPDWIFNDDLYISSISVDEEILIESGEDELVDISKDVKEVEKNRNPDVYAYYLPFHFYRTKWGIYIKASGILAITAYLLGQKNLIGIDTSIINAVYRILLEHEAFHYKVELACSRFEIPLIELLNIHGIKNYPYLWYFSAPIAAEHEEAMANAHALTQLEAYHNKVKPCSTSQYQMIRALIFQFMDSQPSGYKDYGSYLHKNDFKHGQDKTIDSIRDSTYLNIISPSISKPPPSQIPGRQFFLDNNLPPCPIYLVQDKPSRILKIVKPFPAKGGVRVVIHTRDHPPPHFHLECPIGNEKGRYEWPSLKPLKGEETLSNKERKKLDIYLNQYREKIDQKINSVYFKVEVRPLLDI